MNKFGPKLTKDQRRDVLAMVADGVPYAEIADAFGINQSAVTYHAQRSGYDQKREQKQARHAHHNDTGGLAQLLRPQAWMEQALCAQTDPETFFPEKGGTTSPAKRVCRECPVAAECLEYALAHNERFGIWGGLSERDRRKLLRNHSSGRVEQGVS